MSLKEIKTRINSVKSTRQVTSAMKMVSSAKLHHAQQRVEHMLPYQQKLCGMLRRFLTSADSVQTVYTEPREVKKVAIVAFSSNTSLCGSFNSNVARALDSELDKFKSLGHDNITVIPVGKKIAKAVRKRGFDFSGDYEAEMDRPSFALVQPLAQKLVDMYLKHEVDRIDLIYHHFRSAGSQQLVTRTYLPIDLSAFSATDGAAEAGSGRKYNDNYIVEPSMEGLLESMLPVVLDMQVFAAFLDSSASEHAARMMAMQTATDNANELIYNLTIQYNKGRQQAITSELLDISSATAGQ